MIAYLILVHRFPKQFERLFKALHDPANTYLVHVDEKSDPSIRSDISRFLADYPNTAVMESSKALWGGYSLVDVELRGMARLLDMNRDWKFFINLSGQDFPLKSPRYIRDYLSRRQGQEFIRVNDQQRVRPDTMHRVHEYVIELGDRLIRTAVDRPFLAGVTPYIGNQWMIVGRRFCRFVCGDAKADRYKDFYRNTFIPDEGFFQTVMMNSGVHGEIVNDDLRTIDWIPDGDIKLRPRTFTSTDAARLIASPDLFARKFDSDVDDVILGILERHVATPETDDAPMLGLRAAA